MKTALYVTAESRSTVARTLRELAADAALEQRLPPQRVNDVRLCVDEAVTNVVTHAYDDAEGWVELSIEVVGDELKVVVSDHGAPAVAGDGDSDGLGLRLMSHLAQHCTLTVHPTGTEVEMVFAVAPPAQSTRPEKAGWLPPGQSSTGDRHA